MARQTKTTKKQNNSKGATKKQGQPLGKKDAPQKAVRAGEKGEGVRFFDDKTRRDIGGVVLAVVAIVLFIAAVMPSDALVTSFMSQALHSLFGIGSYILPFILLIIGATFLIQFEREKVSLRATIGLLIVFVAVLGLLALFTPQATVNSATLFYPLQLEARGGYVGAGIAWVGLTLFGQIVTCVILAGAIIAGIIIIGFSITDLVNRIRAHATKDADDLDALDSPPYAQIRRPKPQGLADEPEKTRRFGKDVLKPRKATGSLNTRVIGDGDDAGTVSNAAMTRKLGKKSKGADDTVALPGKGSSPASQGAKTATALPNPQEDFELPAASLLKYSKRTSKGLNSEEDLKETAYNLQETLEDFNILAQVVGWVAGPTVTLFKVDLPAGVRVSRITALEDDIALALAAQGVRIFAPIPGTNHVGIEVPNRQRENVLLGDVLKDAPAGPLQLAIGKDVEGHSIISDLSQMPHLLIGGTTGSGKSVSINAMIMSILMRATPSEVRLIMIDPKRVEFTPYNGIPHLYVPVVTEPREAASALSWGVAEMERRLKVFSAAEARNIGQYNAKVQQGLMEDESATEMPYLVIIIDELADLMMNVGKEVEFSISRIAQLARAAGIHLIVATQRPSTNVVTGLIKANITNRIAFNVASGIDSRVVLDTPGAENLIGLGDLLLSRPELAKPQRIQGCYVSEAEISAVVGMLKKQGEPEYHSEILKTNLITLGASSPDGNGGGGTSSDDPLIWEAADIVVSSGLGSTSNIQRRLKVGYSRAGRIMDMLEEKGIVGSPNGSKPREVLVDALELETLRAFEERDGNDYQPYTEG